MRVFVTGATGFIGSFLVPELINAGHHVVGLSRSAVGAEALTRAGAEVFRGDVNQLDRLRTAAKAADGVIHAAFNHDVSNLKENSEDDRKVIETLGAALTGSDRPLVITSGTGLARSKTGGLAVERALRKYDWAKSTRSRVKHPPASAMRNLLYLVQSRRVQSTVWAARCTHKSVALIPWLFVSQS